MQTTTSLRRGDIVQVITGRCKGKAGKILEVDRANARVLLENINLKKRHLKPTQKQPQGGIVEKPAPLHWSNVMLVCGKCQRPARLRHTVVEGKKQRVCHKCGNVIGN